MSQDDDEEYQVWRRAVDELVAKGESLADAVEAAHMVLQAHRRKRRAFRDATARTNASGAAPDKDPESKK